MKIIANQEGQSLPEYSLILVFIAIGASVVITYFAASIAGVFMSVIP